MPASDDPLYNHPNAEVIRERGLPPVESSAPVPTAAAVATEEEDFSLFVERLIAGDDDFEESGEATPAETPAPQPAPAIAETPVAASTISSSSQAPVRPRSASTAPVSPAPEQQPSRSSSIDELFGELDDEDDTPPPAPMPAAEEVVEARTPTAAEDAPVEQDEPAQPTLEPLPAPAAAERPVFGRAASLEEDAEMWTHFANDEDDEEEASAEDVPAEVVADRPDESVFYGDDDEIDPEAEDGYLDEPYDPDEETFDPEALAPQLNALASFAGDSEASDKLAVVSRRAFFGGPNGSFASIISPNLRDDFDELSHPLSAFADLQEGQRGFIRLSLRPAPAFKSESTAWLNAVKYGQDTGPQETSRLKALFGWAHYFARYLWYSGNKTSKYFGGSAPPLRPGAGMASAKPLTASQMDDDTKRAMDDAKKKQRDSVHFDVALRVGVIGSEKDATELNRIADEVAAGFDVYRTEHQDILFTEDSPVDTVRGLMIGDAEGKLILSAGEVGMLAKVPDDTMKPDGVKIVKSQFKHIPPSNPIILDRMSKALIKAQAEKLSVDDLGKALGKVGPEQGLIPLGIISPRSEDARVVGMRVDELDQHMFYCGRTGSGKSEIMKWLIYGCAKADYPIVLIDPHGALSSDVMNGLIVNCPERLKDIVLCDLGDPDYPVALNPLDIHSAQAIEPTVNSIMEMLNKQMSLDKSGAPRATNFAHLALSALAEANLHLHDPDTKCTLLHIVPFFQDPAFRQLVVSFGENIAVKEMFDPDLGPYEQMNPKQQQEMAMPIIRAFQQLSRSDSFSAVFASSENKLDFAKLITENKIVLIKLARFHTQQMLGEFVGALVLPYLLSTLGDWGRQRDPETGVLSGRGCRVFVDEAPRLLGPDSSAMQIMAEARKWDLGLVFASQYLDQFDKSVIQATLANTATKLSLVLDPSSASVIAKSLAGTSSMVSANDIADLPKYHFYGNVLLSQPGGGSANSGVFSAACLPPLYCKLSDSDKKDRDKVIERSRILVSNSRAEMDDKRLHGLESIKSALTVMHSEKIQSDSANSGAAGTEFAVDFDSGDDTLWN